MNDNTQPEALRLAEILEGDYCPDWFYEQGVDEVAAELRRQHTRIAELESELEAVGAGGVSGPLMGRAALSANAGEPVAWESTTPGYIKYITQARYEKFSPAVLRWYKPYRCSGCAERGAGFDACDMATAAAQGFRRGQAAAKQEG